MKTTIPPYLKNLAIDVIYTIASHNGPNKLFPLALSNQMGMTLSYLNSILSSFEKNNIIRYQIKGRRKYIVLTPKGKEISTHIILLHKCSLELSESKSFIY